MDAQIDDTAELGRVLFSQDEDLLTEALADSALHDPSAASFTRTNWASRLGGRSTIWRFSPKPGPWRTSQAVWSICRCKGRCRRESTGLANVESSLCQAHVIDSAPNRIQTGERKWGPCGSISRRCNPFEINRESTWGHMGPDGGTKQVLVRNEKVAGSNPVGSTILCLCALNGM